MMPEFNDKPIKAPEEDKFGFKALAEAIAASIAKMTAPDGTVIAVNGPWGSGKSSLINLVWHHLANPPENKDLNLKIVDFKCWWFRGEEALTIAFFRELCSAMEPDEQETKKAISELGAQLLASPLAGAMTNLVAPTMGPVFMECIASFIKQDETVEKLHKKICDKLQNDSNRYLIIIDDVDRLSPDEAILIFRLVKSVGGLPNVIYLLAYDRQLAEKIVTKFYPSEGPHYLEKIVQASFDLPKPSRVSLEKEFLSRLHDSMIEEKGFVDTDYFRSLFTQMILPEIKTPRDLLRILNPLKVTWPAVKGEVYPADFLCLETLRIQRPKLYATLRSNKSFLTGTDVSMPFQQWVKLEQERSFERYEKIFLESEPPSERERLRDGLRQLFPMLADRTNLPDDSPVVRFVQRRVCSSKHFDTYFRFSLPEHQIPMSEIEKLIAKAGDSNYIQHSLLNAKWPDGSPKAISLLEELAIRTGSIPENDIGNLFKAIFPIADRLVEREGKGMFSSTMKFLQDITRRLLLKRLTLEARSEVLHEACEQAALGWLTHIAASAYRDHSPTENTSPKPPEECLTTEEHAVELKDLAVKRIREAATDGSLIDVPYMGAVLLWWKSREDDKERIRSWASDCRKNDLAVARMAKAFTGGNVGSSFSGECLNDPRDTLGSIVDLNEFQVRAKQVLKEGKLEVKELEALKIFLDEWQKQENHNQ